MNHLGGVLLVVCLAGAVMSAEGSCQRRAIQESPVLGSLLTELRANLPNGYKLILANEVLMNSVESLDGEQLRILINVVDMAYSTEQRYKQFKVSMAMLNCN